MKTTEQNLHIVTQIATQLNKFARLESVMLLTKFSNLKTW